MGNLNIFVQKVCKNICKSQLIICVKKSVKLQNAILLVQNSNNPQFYSHFSTRISTIYYSLLNSIFSTIPPQLLIQQIIN